MADAQRIWEKSWERKAKAISNGVLNGPWRQDESFMEHIQCPKQGYDRLYEVQLQRCKQANVPIATMQDSTVGDPKLVDGCSPMSLRYAFMAHWISTHWQMPSNMSVLEIGGGYGGMARTLTQFYGAVKYYFIDHPVMQNLQQIYLKQTTGQQADTHWPTTVDLVVNSNSFGEMNTKELSKYFDKIQATLPEGGALCSFNRIFRDVSFYEYPFDSDWAHQTEIAPDGRFMRCLSVRKMGAGSAHPWKQYEERLKRA